MDSKVYLIEYLPDGKQHKHFVGIHKTEPGAIDAKRTWEERDEKLNIKGEYRIKEYELLD